ncbi:MAG TPA: DUF378 domain-containing protein [Candidatus Paceibacterota bacterium]|nr:uncharacterized protein [Patescibacteria group bacterium]
MNTKNSVSKVAWLLVIIGALNWGLEGLGNLVMRELNLVYILVGRWPMLETLVYVLVGLSALYIIIKGKKGCTCGSCM